MADLYRMLIKSEDGKTKVVLGTKTQYGEWQDLQGNHYHEGPGVPPQAEREEKDGTVKKWTLLDTEKTDRKVGR